MWYYIVNRVTGARLCNDGRWREHAPFGNTSMCAKIYHVFGWAERKRWRIEHAEIVGFNPEYFSMDAAGYVWDEKLQKCRGHVLTHVRPVCATIR